MVAALEKNNLEIEIEAHFSEVGESCASTFDVSAGPQVGDGESHTSAVSAKIGFVTISEKNLSLLIDCRLRCYVDGAWHAKFRKTLALRS